MEVIVIANIHTVLALLPAASRVRLEAFAKSAVEILGDDLVAAIIFGSAVRGGLTPRSACTPACVC